MWNVRLGLLGIKISNLLYKGIHGGFVGGDSFEAVTLGGRFRHATDAKGGLRYGGTPAVP